MPEKRRGQKSVGWGESTEVVFYDILLYNPYNWYLIGLSHTGEEKECMQNIKYLGCLFINPSIDKVWPLFTPWPQPSPWIPRTQRSKL